jgi:DNA-binding NarL/FixJ family response regulator
MDMTTVPDRLRLLLVDDHPAVREAVRRRLEVEPRFQVVGEAGDIGAALTQIEATRPHLAVIDIGLGNVSGLLLARVVRERYPETLVLIWSMYANPDYVAEAKAAGARGYVLKSGPLGEIVKAIEAVAEGGCYYSEAVDRSSIPNAQLTTREKQVLKLVAGGKSSAQVAKQLRISRRTVESIRRNIMSKLGAKNPVEMVTIAIRNGQVDVHDVLPPRS